jgi:hypothetical protein
VKRLVEEKVYEKHSWLLLLAISIIGLLFSFMFLMGIRADPQATMDSLERSVGLALLWASVMTIGLVTVAYKKGEKGAWYAFLIVPITLIGYTVLNLSIGGSLWQMFIILLIIALLGLLLPFRKFFPRK